MPPGTVQFELLVQSGVEGTVTKLPFKESGGKKLTTNGDVPEIGTISYQMNGTKETVNFTAKDCDSLNNFQIDNKVGPPSPSLEDKEHVCMIPVRGANVGSTFLGEIRFV